VDLDSNLKATYDFFEGLGQRSDLAPNLKLSLPCLLYDPIYFNGRIEYIEIERQFDSNAKPLLLGFHYKDNPTKKRVIYKNNSDLRRDMFIQLMFSVFNSLWGNSSLMQYYKEPLSLTTYNTVPIGINAGLLEFVENSEPVHSFDWKCIEFLKRDDKYILIFTQAASFAASWVLGIRDRHQDNMMIRNKIHFFHIDFGWIFNVGPTLDASPIAIHPDFKRTTGEEDWKIFKEYCSKAFFILRNNAGMITNFSVKLFNFLETSSEKILETNVRRHLKGAFMLEYTNLETEVYFATEIERGVISWRKSMKWMAHTLNIMSSQK